MISESLTDELRQVEARALSLVGDFNDFANALSEIKTRALALERSFSNSVFGDHALTYYEGFKPPPRGFDVEWGFVPGFSGSYNPGWSVHSVDELVTYVYGEYSFDEVDKRNAQLEELANELRDRAVDLLAVIADDAEGATLRITQEITEKILDAFAKGAAGEYVKRVLNGSPRITRDSRNINQGIRTPVHTAALAQLYFLDETTKALTLTADSTRRVLLTAELAKGMKRQERTGNAVFIGHGRSPVWRELQAYLEKDLGLFTEEFNSEPVAGLSTQARLNDMLNKSSMAFLIMTGEDAASDGTVRARENVIHEAGLFQGHLGWTRAIVLLEEGCREFSNLHGVNHIKFGKGNIKDAFVDVRRSLIREKLIKQ